MPEDEPDTPLDVRTCCLCGTASAAWVAYPCGTLCAACDVDAAARDSTPTPLQAPRVVYDPIDALYREWGGES